MKRFKKLIVWGFICLILFNNVWLAVKIIRSELDYNSEIKELREKLSSLANNKAAYEMLIGVNTHVQEVFRKRALAVFVFANGIALIAGIAMWKTEVIIEWIKKRRLD